MTNISKRDFIKGATAVGAVGALAAFTYTDLITKAKPSRADKNFKPSGFMVATDDNYPVFVIDDTLVVDNRTNKYEQEGWYIWEGKVWNVRLAPHGDGELCAYQIRGEMRVVQYDDFKPIGRVTESIRKIRYV